jgi:integrase
MSRVLVVPVKRKGKTGWWGNVILPSGRRRRVLLGRTKDVADARAREITLKLAKGESIEIEGIQGPTFAEFIEKFYGPKKEGKRFWGHEQWRMRRLIEKFGKYPIRAIDLAMIEHYIVERKKTCARFTERKINNATINRELGRLKNILYMAERLRIISANPMRRFSIGGKGGLEETPRTRFLTKAEFDRLLRYLPAPIRRIVIMAVYTGMRRGELQKLDWSDIRLRERRLLVKLDKDGNTRPVPISDTVTEMLQGVPGDQRHGKAFVWEDGRPIKDFRGSFTKASDEAGIEDLHFHDLRHTAISWMLAAGVPPRTVADIVGHKTLVMIMRYAHVSDPMKDEATKKLEAYVNAQTEAPQEISSGVITSHR